MTTIIYLNGKSGRMGRALVPLIQNSSDFALGEDLASCDVVIDFSVPSALLTFLPSCVEAKKPLVIGTTGYGEVEKKMIEEASKKIPLFYAPNFSLGMALIREAARNLAERVDETVSVEIVEAHNKSKKDCPSGSALALAEEIGRVSSPIHSIRAGDIIGDHTVIFGFDGERIELKHQVHSRDAFARGALQAAKFIKSQPAGYYMMKDLVYASC